MTDQKSDFSHLFSGESSPGLHASPRAGAEGLGRADADFIIQENIVQSVIESIIHPTTAVEK